jgi:hypothetical protein
MTELLEIFYQPGKVFESLPERRWVWVLPLILNILLITLQAWAVPHYMGRENIARQQLETFARSLTPEQMQAAVSRANSPSQIYIGLASAAVSAAVILLIIAGALMAFGMMTSQAPTFGAMFSMVALAYFPYWLVAVAMSVMVLMISPDPTSLDWRNLLATNVAAFMNKNETSKGLYSLMGSVDILNFAVIGLLALGFSKLTRARFGFGLAAVLVIWAFYVLGKMGFSIVLG